MSASEQHYSPDGGQRTIVFPSRIAEIKVSYSRKVKDCDRFKITDSESAVAVLRSRWKKGRIQYVEEFKTIFLDRSNRVLGLRTVSQGGQAGCPADPKIIFGAALKAHAAALIAAHNHPSGQLSPSQADIHLTRKLKEIGILLDLPLLDHIILTQDDYTSFADQGML